MKFKRQVTAEEGVNLTPLIDVVFLLLIFFMVSTTFTKETHLKIDLPKAATDALQPKDKNQIEVLINAQGGYSVNGQALVNQEKETLKRAIEKVAGDLREIPFLITGDSEASYQKVVTVMDLAGEMGFVNLSMTTQSQEAE